LESNQKKDGNNPQEQNTNRGNFSRKQEPTQTNKSEGTQQNRNEGIATSKPENPSQNKPEGNQQNKSEGNPQNKTAGAQKSENKNVAPKPPRKPYFYGRNRRPYFNKEKSLQQEAVKKSSFKSLSIVIPLYNEEESLSLLASEIKKYVKPLGMSFEIIFVDDGSTDNSLKIIKELARTDTRIKYLSFNNNYGKSAALQLGFKQATGDVVITMDADLQDDPSEIPNLINKLDEGYDLISGWKKQRHDPFIKKHSSKFFNYTTKVMSGIKIHDFNCGLKAYRNSVVKNINIYGELHRYVPVLAGWQGYRITEIPVKHNPRKFGKTKFGISRFFKGFIDLLTVMFTTRYIKRPMHLFGFLGALAFLIGFIVNGYLTYEWLIGKTFIGNRPLLFLGILLIIVGVQFFSVGLLGELIVHNTQSDKEYIVKDKN